MATMSALATGQGADPDEVLRAILWCADGWRYDDATVRDRFARALALFPSSAVREAIAAVTPAGHVHPLEWIAGAVYV